MSPAGNQKVYVDDGDFAVRYASFDQLIELNEEAAQSGLTAKWSSQDALHREVRSGSGVFLVPLFRQRGDSGQVDHYRCHIWFVGDFEGNAVVSLFDVKATSYGQLKDLSSPANLKRVVRVILDNSKMEPIG